MKIRRFSFILVFMLFLNTLVAPLAFAKSGPAPKHKLNIVALGDSITFGYPPPSTTAFPDLISGAGNVVKFGGSGYTSTQLLAAINSNPRAFHAALREADVITINIGSNDVMQATGVATLFGKLQPLVTDLPTNLANGNIAQAIAGTTLTPLTPQQLGLYTQNLTTIIGKIKRQTDAPILLYNLYDPIVLTNIPTLDLLLSPLHTFAEANIAAVNGTIANVGKGKGIYVVDAYSTFKANASTYIIPFDIHPTLAGHQALAALADTTIKSIKHDDYDREYNHCNK